MELFVCLDYKNRSKKRDLLDPNRDESTIKSKLTKKYNSNRFGHSSLVKLSNNLCYDNETFVNISRNFVEIFIFKSEFRSNSIIILK